MLKELLFVWKGFKFLFIAALVLVVGFSLFILVGKFFIGFLIQIGVFETGKYNISVSVLFVIIIIFLEAFLLWFTGKYIIPFLKDKIL